jgi:lipopolysaccharide transport system ATP-binding protein
VVQHCSRCIVISHGEVAIDGPPIDGFNYYLKLLYGKDARSAGPGTAAAPVIDLPAVGDDRVPARPGYNPHEYRYGNAKARIFDAAMEIDGGPSLIARSGARMRITLDVVFHAPVPRPFYGFVIKTKENVRVYGTTNAMQGREAAAVSAPTQTQVVITVPLPLPQGEYFMDLGLGETVDDEIVVVDARVSCFHFYVGPTPWCNGLADFAATFEETARRALAG